MMLAMVAAPIGLLLVLLHRRNRDKPLRDALYPSLARKTLVEFSPVQMQTSSALHWRLFEGDLVISWYGIILKEQGFSLRNFGIILFFEDRYTKAFKASGHGTIREIIFNENYFTVLSTNIHCSKVVFKGFTITEMEKVKALIEQVLQEPEE